MRDHILDVSLRTVGAVGTSAGALGAMDIFNKAVQIPVWGVPVTTFGAAAVGAGVSLFFGEPVASARDLWKQIIASMILGVAFSVLVADGFGWEWASKHQSLFALVTAAFVRWFMQPVIDRVKDIIKEYKFNFNFGKKGGGT